jgi:hypothetical protein
MAYLPNKVYRHLPDLYVIAGIYVLLNVDRPIGYFSGILLVAAGLFVFHFRLKQSSTK